MAGLRLSALPDRTTVKITVNLSPDLNQTLADYAAAYEAAYGKRESVANLIPYMLASFLESDREFGRIRKARSAKS